MTKTLISVLTVSMVLATGSAWACGGSGSSAEAPRPQQPAGGQQASNAPQGGGATQQRGNAGTQQQAPQQGRREASRGGRGG